MRVRLLSLLIMFGLLAGSCGAVRPEPLAFVDEDARPGQSVLTVATWDATALTPAIEAWEAEHPTARVVVETLPFDDHHADALDPGTAAADVIAIDARYGADFRNRTDLFADQSAALDTVEAAPDWRAAEGVADDGTVTSTAIDTGSLAFAIRIDLLQEVDDPMSGGTLARAIESISTWCDLIELGDVYSESTGRAFLPAASDVFEIVLRQSGGSFVDTDGTRVHETSADVQHAWETAMLAIGAPASARQFDHPCPTLGTTKRITAARSPLTASWDVAIGTGEIAAVPAPSWMLERIRTVAPTTAGSWTLLPVPGGPVSIGGTSLAVSANTEHDALARDLIEHLARPTSQSTTFREFGNLPASAARYEVPAVLDHREPFFDDTPIGERYIDAIAELTPAASAPQDQEIMQEFRAAVARVDAGTQTPGEAWSEALWRIDLLLDDA